MIGDIFLNWYLICVTNVFRYIEFELFWSDDDMLRLKYTCIHLGIFALLALCEGNPPTKASDAEFLCFLWTAPEQTVEQTIDTPVIWDAIVLIMTSL